MGNHTVKAGSTLQSLTCLERSRRGVLNSGGREEKLDYHVTSIYMDLGVPMLVEIRSDSFTSNSLTDRLGAGPSKKHIGTRYFWIQARVRDGDLTIKRVPTAKNGANVRTKPVSAIRTTKTLQVCRIGLLLTMDPTLHYLISRVIIEISVASNRRRRCSTESGNRQVSALVANIEMNAKLSETIETAK